MIIIVMIVIIMMFSTIFLHSTNLPSHAIITPSNTSVKSAKNTVQYHNPVKKLGYKNVWTIAIIINVPLDHALYYVHN